jgi:hypothetical protein
MKPRIVSIVDAKPIRDEDIISWARLSYEGARQNFLQFGYLVPVLLVLTPHPTLDATRLWTIDMTQFFTSSIGKEWAAQFIPLWLKSIKAYAMLLMTEAWGSGDTKNAISQLDKYGSLKNLPGVKEYLVATLETTDDVRTFESRIIREGNKVSLKKIRERPAKDVMGRMIGWLYQPTSH